MGKKNWFKSPWIIRELTFSGPVRLPYPTGLFRKYGNTLQLSGKTRTSPDWYVCGKFCFVFVATLMTLGHGRISTEAVKILICPHDDLINTHPINTKLASQNFLPIFFLSPKFWICFLVKHPIVPILGMFNYIDLKWKGSKSVGYWADYVTSILWPHPLPGPFQGEILK